jgi:Tfp pilus assembly protein PilN
MRDADFLPENIRDLRHGRRRRRRQAYLLMACVLALAGVTHLRSGQIAHARAEVAEVESRADALQRDIDKIPPLEQQMSDLLIKKRIDSELGSRADATCVLAELCRLMPPNVAILSLELKTVGVAGDDKAHAATDDIESGRRVRLVLTGIAPTDVDTANFIGQMATSCLFEDVNMGYSRNATFKGRLAREFQASCTLTR